MSATTRLRVKLGAAEIEYEGESGFLKDEVMPTVSKMLAMVESRSDLQKSPPAVAADNLLASSDSGAVLDHSLSTSTIATKLKANSSGELAIAAAAHLTLVQGRGRITRQELLDEMKSATSFYKSSFNNNLTNTLKTLVRKDRLRLVSADTYALSAKELADLGSL